MASPRSFFVLHEPVMSMRTRRKKVGNGQQKREELQREVSMLQNILEREQKVNEILEKAQCRESVLSPSFIPDFVPSKAKQLVEELAMVEDEIARLENQIEQIQTELTHEKDVTSSSNPKQATTINSTNPNNISEYSAFAPNSGRGAGPDQKKLFETKTLHFISKAIKGDYNLDDFGIAKDKLTRSSKRVVFSDQKENKEVRSGNQENKVVSSKSGILKPSSPLRTPRHPTPKRDRNVEIEMPAKYVGTNPPVQYTEEENIQKWSPNKLSENIVKCLIMVYVRLLRTSRAMELEKSGPITRSSNFSSSFRVNYDTSSCNSKAALLQRESRQQDPYGVFDSEEAIPRDIGPYKNLVIFMSTNLDPKCISHPSSIPLLQRLRVLMNGLQKVDLRYLTYQQKLAFWINMYNACVMHGFLQYGVPSSPENLLSLMNKATLSIGGSTINAQGIEHFILRKPEASMLNEVYHKEENKEAMMVYNRYGLEPSERNVTFALCCGTRSSPTVKIYTAEGVATELEKSKLEYLQASIIVTNTKRIAFPELLLRNMHDFAQDVDSLVEWVCHQLPTSGSLRKSMVECYRGTSGLHSNGKLSTVVQNIPYDFEFMYLLTV